MNNDEVVEINEVDGDQISVVTEDDGVGVYESPTSSSFIDSNTNYHSDEDVKSGNAIIKLVAFCIVLPFFGAAIITKLISELLRIDYGMLFTPIVFLTIYSTYKFLSISDSGNHNRVDEGIPDSPSVRRKPYRKNNGKKYNTLKEYEASDDYDADIERERVEANRKKQDNIDLAVEGLVRLGMGKRKAQDWVSRAIDSGIKSSDTAELIKFALHRGRS